MLQLRVIAALAGWGWLMMLSMGREGGLLWTVPCVGFLLAVLPIRWFPALLGGQVVLLGLTFAFVRVPPLRFGWLPYVFLALMWLLNFALYLGYQRGRAMKASRGEPSRHEPPVG